MLFFLLPRSLGRTHMPLVKTNLSFLSFHASDSPLASEGKDRGREHRLRQTRVGAQMTGYVWASSVSIALIPD